MLILFLKQQIQNKILQGNFKRDTTIKNQPNNKNPTLHLHKQNKKKTTSKSCEYMCKTLTNQVS